MSFTTNRYRTETGERLLTVKLTFKVTAEEIALALMSDTGACYVHENEVPVTEESIRDALYAMFSDGLERASYLVGDNGGGDKCDQVKDQVVDVVFGGQEISPSFKRPAAV